MKVTIFFLTVSAAPAYWRRPPLVLQAPRRTSSPTPRPTSSTSSWTSTTPSTSTAGGRRRKVSVAAAILLLTTFLVTAKHFLCGTSGRSLQNALLHLHLFFKLYATFVHKFIFACSHWLVHTGYNIVRTISRLLITRLMAFKCLDLVNRLLK